MNVITQYLLVYVEYISALLENMRVDLFLYYNFVFHFVQYASALWPNCHLL